jgi:hypothetical protein
MFPLPFSDQLVIGVIESFSDIIDQSKLQDPEPLPPQLPPFPIPDDEADEPPTSMHQVVQQIVHPGVWNYFKQLKAHQAARSILDEYKSVLPVSDHAKEEIRIAFRELEKLETTDTIREAQQLTYLLVDFVAQHCMLLVVPLLHREILTVQTLISQAQMNLDPKFLNRYPRLSPSLRTIKG